ncbi:hypothetical protein [Methanoregula sp.]|uniref:hypothetical protein n=1 Tax=Methanoregula sp. TaxID=2052170 RepID=UPI002BEFD465|nr:hypothetical protein [Methanoregula sp.]HVP96805.1 hypothetical protein [Methanoregula sp.]
MQNLRHPPNLYGNAGQCSGTTDGIRLTPITPTTLLEYSGAGLGILGWLGVRQVGSLGAQEIGFIVWIISGLVLIVWGYHTKARAIMVINVVNVIMAASALVALT